MFDLLVSLLRELSVIVPNLKNLSIIVFQDMAFLCSLKNIDINVVYKL